MADNQVSEESEKVDTIMRMVEPNLGVEDDSNNEDGNVRYSHGEAGVKVTVFKKSKPSKQHLKMKLDSGSSDRLKLDVHGVAAGTSGSSVFQLKSL